MVSFALEPSQLDEDRLSCTSTGASTIATTTSLASRIASLALDFGDKLKESDEVPTTKESRFRKQHDDTRGQLEGAEEGEEGEEEVVEITEEEMLQMLDNQEPPLQVRATRTPDTCQAAPCSSMPIPCRCAPGSLSSARATQSR
jgi:hypothetical protein